MDLQEIGWWELWTGLLELRVGTGGAYDSSECCDERLGFVKCG